VGDDSERGEFLASIGLCTAADLDKPIRLPDDRCTLPTFDVRGRVLEKSPNQFHPDAVVITHAALQLDNDAEFWTYRMFYSDKHWERTSWTVSIGQNCEKTLSEFCDNVRIWMDDVLIEPGSDDKWRSHRLKQWDRVHDALGEVFYFEAGDGELQEKLTDALMAVDGGALTQHRIRLKGSVARTMFRWAQEATKPEPKKKAKR
jgi:hypothetical protein